MICECCGQDNAELHMKKVTIIDTKFHLCIGCISKITSYKNGEVKLSEVINDLTDDILELKLKNLKNPKTSDNSNTDDISEIKIPKDALKRLEKFENNIEQMAKNINFMATVLYVYLWIFGISIVIWIIWYLCNLR